MDLIQYLIISTISLSVSYLAFRLIFRDEARFRQQRTFLLSSLAVSLVLPITGYRLDLNDFFQKSGEPAGYFQIFEIDNISQAVSRKEPRPLTVNNDLLINVHAAISIFLVFLVAIQYIKILKLYIISQKTRHPGEVILSGRNIKSPFSFFRWIFIPDEITGYEERESIIIHESIHVSQYHSIDNL